MVQDDDKSVLVFLEYIFSQFFHKKEIRIKPELFKILKKLKNIASLLVRVKVNYRKTWGWVVVFKLQIFTGCQYI